MVVYNKYLFIRHIPLCPLGCRLSHRETSPLQGLHIAVASYQGQGFIPWATSHAFSLTNLCHSLLSCTILLACLKSKPFFFKHSFTVSIHPFCCLPTEQLSAYSLGNLHPLHMAEPMEHILINLHNFLIHAFRTLSILLIPSKPLGLFICTAISRSLLLLL